MSGKKLFAIIVLVVVVLLLIGILPPGISIIASVPAGCTGILTSYGKVESVALEPGLHFKAPFQKIVVMDNRVRTMQIASGTKNATTTDTAETKDQQLLPVFEFEIQYQLNRDKSYVVYSNYGSNYEDRIMKSNALQFIKETFAEYNADQIVIAKSEIPAKLKEKLMEVTAPVGIDIIRINFVTYDFSPEYTQILEQRALLNAQLQNNELEQKNQKIAAQTSYDVAVKQAEKEAETKRIQSENANQIAMIEAENANEIALKEAEAKAKSDKIYADNQAYVTRTKAEAERDARVAEAEAEKAELEAKSSGLNDYIIQQEFIDKWDGKLIPSFNDTGFGFINYTDIIKQYIGGGASE